MYYPRKIIYEDGKYNSEDLVRIKEGRYGYFFIYSIAIRNISQNTIKSVTVTVEGNKALHKRSNQDTCDINPGAIELFNLYASSDKASMKGEEITIVASGQDIPVTEKAIIL